MKICPVPENSSITSSASSTPPRWFFPIYEQLLNGYSLRGIFGFLFLGPFLLPNRKKKNDLSSKTSANGAEASRTLLTFYRNTLARAPGEPFDASIYSTDAPVLKRTKHLNHLLCRELSTDPSHPLSPYSTSSDYFSKTDTYNNSSSFCACFLSWAEHSDRKDLLEETVSYYRDLLDYLLDGTLTNKNNLCELLRQAGIPLEHISQDPGKLLLCCLLNEAVSAEPEKKQVSMRQVLLGHFAEVNNLPQDLPCPSAVCFSLSENFFSMLLESLLSDFSDERMNQLKNRLPELSPDGLQLLKRLVEKQLLRNQQIIMSSGMQPDDSSMLERLVLSSANLIKLKQLL